MLIFLYQIPFIFQGLDFADEGMHATFYRWIFDDPRSVQYCFMYWFSGIIGGAWVKLFPSFGLLGIRFAGVLTTTFTIILAFNLLKRYLNPVPLMWGLFLALALNSNFPYGLYYDNLSALFFIITLWLLFYGLLKNKFINFFLSGIFVALSIFTRIPNLLEVGLILLILYYGFVIKNNFKLQVKQIFLFLAGIIFCSGVIIFLMKASGQYDLFVGNMKLVAKMGASPENTHGVKALIKCFLHQYPSTLGVAILGVIFILLFHAATTFLSARFNFKPSLKKIISFAAILVFCFFSLRFATKGHDLWKFLVLFLAGLIFIFGSMMISRKEESKEIKLLMLMGILMLLILPQGSDGGIFSLGRYCFWIPLPVIFHYLYGMNAFDSKIAIANNDKPVLYSLSIEKKQVRHYIRWMLMLSLIICFSYAYFYPFFDRGNRINMTFKVDNKYLRGIYTEKERASSVNEMLIEANKYVNKNDYVLAYDCMPMFHYLTDTKPFMKNPWPWLYDSDIFERELNTSYQEIGKLPVIVQQKVNTINSNWPQNIKIENYFDYKNNSKRNGQLSEFMVKHNYRIVWENDAFRIIIPPGGYN
jgi:hypothetical protein